MGDECGFSEVAPAGELPGLLLEATADVCPGMMKMSALSGNSEASCAGERILPLHCAVAASGSSRQRWPNFALYASAKVWTSSYMLVGKVVSSLKTLVYS
jgi:hypothetical protein